VIFSLLVAATALSGPADLGRKLASDARRGGAQVLAVAAFEAPASAPRGLAPDAADGVLRGAVASGRVRVVERERLGAVFSERRLAAAGASADVSASPRLGAGDAVVLGRLEKSAAGWILTARVVAVATGEILGSGRAVMPEAVAALPPEESFPSLDALVDEGHALALSMDADGLRRSAEAKDVPSARRAAAVLALAESDPSADMPLADALRDEDPLVRLAAAMALGRSPSAWADAPLRRSLRTDSSWLARFGAAQALSRYGSESSARDLEIARAEDPSWRVRRQAADSLAARGEMAP